jgi:hypothetical protein
VGGFVAGALGVGAQAIPALALVSASLLKAQSRDGFGRTLKALGVPSGLAPSAAMAVIAAEFSTGGGLLVVPASILPRIMLCLLALAFAAAAVSAVVRKRSIACSCFGAMGSHRLGWTQVALLPAWLLAAVLAQLDPPAWTAQEGELLLGSLLLGLIATQLYREIPAWRRLHEDRVVIAAAVAQSSPNGKEGGEHP